jgi:prophage regulatory protein
MRILSFADLKARGIPFTDVWLRELMRQKKFPRLVRISARRVGFLEEEIDQWIRDRLAERDAAA